MWITVEIWKNFKYKSVQGVSESFIVTVNGFPGIHRDVYIYYNGPTVDDPLETPVT